MPCVFNIAYETPFGYMGSGLKVVTKQDSAPSPIGSSLKVVMVIF